MINSACKGLLHVFTGKGKGKTTAAIGMAIRFAGTGKKVFIAQFVKGMPYAELNILDKIPEIEVRQFGQDCFIINKPTKHDISLAKKGLTEAKAKMRSGQYGMVILDEACIAVYYHLFSSSTLIGIIESRAENTEVVVTGRYADPSLIRKADLVTEMKEIKHYYNKGMQAHKGIEF